MSVFAKPLMDLIHVCHVDRNLSNILRGIILIPVHDLRIAWVTCEKSQVLLAGGQVVFLGDLPFFAPPFD